MAQYQIDNVAAPIDFQEDDIILRTLQNAKNLLMCHMGEVPYDRYRGFDASLYDLPIDKLREELLPSKWWTRKRRCLATEPCISRSLWK